MDTVEILLLLLVVANFLYVGVRYGEHRLKKRLFGDDFDALATPCMNGTCDCEKLIPVDDITEADGVGIETNVNQRKRQMN